MRFTGKSSVIGCFVFLAGFSHSAFAVENYTIAPPFGEMQNDVTDTFQNLMHTKNINLDLATLQTFKIIFVPGLLADPVDDVYGYFKDEMTALKTLGLKQDSDFMMIGPKQGFSGEQSIDTNLEVISSEVRASDRPVLLISHSKGSVDALAALVKYPDLRSKVKAWFSIQAPFWGSPIADAITPMPIDSTLLEGIIKLFHGTMASVSELRRPERRDFMNSNAAEITKVISQVKTISFASSKGFLFRMLALSAIDLGYCLPKYNCNGSFIDGLVEVDDALLPGTDYINVTGLDHLDTVLSVGSDLDRQQFMRTMATMLLQSISSPFIKTSDHNSTQEL